MALCMLVYYLIYFIIQMKNEDVTTVPPRCWKIVSWCCFWALYRVHDRPDMRKLQKLQQTFFRFGVKTSLSTLADPKKFNEVIEQIQELPHFEQLQVLLLRSMALAVYQTTNKGHFGLAAEYYAHFTSPIRRYPDLVVHRAIKEKLHLDQGVKSKHEPMPFVNNEMAEQCSQQERRAEKAERQSIVIQQQ